LTFFILRTVSSGFANESSIQCEQMAQAINYRQKSADGAYIHTPSARKTVIS